MGGVHTPQQPGRLPLSSLSALSCSLLGLPCSAAAAGSDGAAVLPSGDVWRRPRAQLVLSIEGLHAGSFLPSLEALRRESWVADLVDDGAAAASAPLAASALYSSVVSDDLSAAVAALAGNGRSEPLTVSVSAAPSAIDDFASSSLRIDAAGGHWPGSSRAELVGLLRDATRREALFASLLSRGGSLVWDDSAGKLTVTLRGGVTGVLSLADAASADFLLELLYVAQLPATLAKQVVWTDALADSTPDMLFVTLSSLPRLADAVGSSSGEYDAALALLDAALPQTLRAFSALSADRMAAVLLLPGQLSRSAMQREADAQAALAARMRRRLLSTTAAYRAAAAAAANATITASRWSNMTAEERAAVGARIEEINVYQITLWTSISLIAALWWAVYMNMYMDAKKDNVLLSKITLNTNRKR
eukprot:PLAT15640.1.p2 GENE.PLAT15640.1~~PLAT15640.1.p2  ORF type:complete len:460 (+),score=286.07 PLAT15640.1:126-1382(+)